MPKTVLKHPFLKVGTVLLHDMASSVEITTEYEEVDVTAFCSDIKEAAQGLGDATVTVDFFQNFDTNSVDETLWPYSQSGGTFQLSITPGMGTTDAQRGSASATNPMYTMQARLFSYSPIAGAVGEASTTSVTFRNGSSLGLRRLTAGSLVNNAAEWW